jgi:predicted methyltransferase
MTITLSRIPRSARLCLALSASAVLLLACATRGAPTPPGAPLNAAQIAALLASPDRSAADRNNDVRRKPAEMLAFIGLKPGMTALDLSAGGGYTTELLARAAGPNGTVYGQNAPRDAAAPPRAPAVPEGDTAPPPAASAAPAAPAVRQNLASRAQNAAGTHIVAVSQPFEAPVPTAVAPGSLDLVTLMFNYHDLGHMGVDRSQMNAAVFRALKSGGSYVVADHAGRPGTGISESGTLHRMEEAFLVRELEAAGFRLAARGDFLRNPADPRDKNTPEPLQPKDEFVVRFVKP